MGTADAGVDVLTGLIILPGIMLLPFRREQTAATERRPAFQAAVTRSRIHSAEGRKEGPLTKGPVLEDTPSFHITSISREYARIEKALRRLMAVAGVEEINSSACLEREVGRKQSREKQISGGGRGNNELS